MTNLELSCHIYFFIAVTYNILSQLWKEVTGKTFATTDPVTGITMVALIYVIYLLRAVIPEFSWYFLMTVFILTVARFGIVHHLLNYSQESYLSKLTWLSAISINIFGVIVLAACLIL